MDYAKESLRLHKEWGGKIEVICKVPCKTKDDLSLVLQGTLQMTSILPPHSL